MVGNKSFGRLSARSGSSFLSSSWQRSVSCTSVFNGNPLANMKLRIYKPSRTKRRLQIPNTVSSELPFQNLLSSYSEHQTFTDKSYKQKLVPYPRSVPTISTGLSLMTWMTSDIKPRLSPREGQQTIECAFLGRGIGPLKFWTTQKSQAQEREDQSSRFDRLILSGWDTQNADQKHQTCS